MIDGPCVSQKCANANYSVKPLKYEKKLEKRSTITLMLGRYRSKRLCFRESCFCTDIAKETVNGILNTYVAMPNLCPGLVGRTGFRRKGKIRDLELFQLPGQTRITDRSWLFFSLEPATWDDLRILPVSHSITRNGIVGEGVRG